MGRRGHIAGAEVPDAHEEYFLYQTLVGTWPLTPLDAPAQAQFVERIAQYMEKALREAKVHTSWINPHAAYEQAVRTFVQRILTPGAGNRFLVDFGRFHARIAPGRLRQLPGADPPQEHRHPASLIFTRGRNCGMIAWSTLTTGALSTFPHAGSPCRAATARPQRACYLWSKSCSPSGGMAGSSST